MNINRSYISDQELLRLAERERAKVVAAFVHKLFARKASVPAHAVAAE